MDNTKMKIDDVYEEMNLHLGKARSALNFGLFKESIAHTNYIIALSVVESRRNEVG